MDRAELVAAQIVINLVLEMRYKMHMLGVQLKEQTMLLGDNMSVVLNTTIPSSSLKKMFTFTLHVLTIECEKQNYASSTYKKHISASSNAWLEKVQEHRQQYSECGHSQGSCIHAQPRES